MRTRSNRQLSSLAQYSKYWALYKQFFHNRYHGNIKYSKPEHVQMFITYLSNYTLLAASTIRCYVSGVPFYFKMYFNYNSTKSNGISMMLKAYANKQKIKQVRKPLNLNMLKELVLHVQRSNMCLYDRLAFIIISNLTYHGAVIISELHVCVSQTTEHIIRHKQVHFDETNSTVNLNYSLLNTLILISPPLLFNVIT